ncbi:hypothetical protein D3C81_2174550 [compost metagenome]
MNSQSCTPSRAEEATSAAINFGCTLARRTISITRVHSPDTTMNTVMQGTVNNIRQPKISTPLRGVSNDV